jgi:hypothetical protein
VAEIFDKLSRTPGRSLYIVSFISKAEIVRATTQVLAVSTIFKQIITQGILELNLKIELQLTKIQKPRSNFEFYNNNTVKTKHIFLKPLNLSPTSRHFTSFC